jgi:hypothetical protein
MRFGRNKQPKLTNKFAVDRNIQVDYSPGWQKKETEQNSKL